ncbi:MAG: T9SS type A sorting domain-containing protein [candidate division WOR-3 bacterium]|nr:T9SS type A sorting domain-containing protein [candidate division WOR-3 bacterium]
MQIGLLAVALAAAVALAGPTDLIKLRSPENPRPLPNGHVAPPRHARNCRLQITDCRLGGVDGVIKDDFPCNDDTASGCKQLAPKLAVGSRGFVVSWYEFRDGDADAWFQRFDSAGNKIGVNERLNTDVTMGWQGDPSSAMGPDGRFLFCWEDRRNIGNSDLFCQRFDAAGTRMGDNFRVSDSAADGDQSMSGAWIAPNGVALLAWDDRRFGLTGDIFAQFLNADGTPLDTNFRVNDDGINVANQYEPEVSGDSSGRFVVAWMDGRGHNSSDWNVFCQRLNSQGQRLGANIQVTTNDSIQQTPDVSCGVSGEFVVTWDDGRNGNQDVYGQRYDANGNPLGQNFKVNDDGGSADQYGSGVAVNSYGEFLVVWTDRRGGEDDVYARRYYADGNPSGPSFRLSDVSLGRQLNPTVEARPGGGYWTAWADARSGDYDIYCQRLDRNANKVGASFRINDDHGSALQRCSSIAMDARGVICVAWEDERNGATDIYRCVTDAAGNVMGPNLRLNDDGAGGAAQYYAAAAAGSGRFIAAWVDMRNAPQSADIYAQYMDGGGMPVGANFRVNTDVSGASQWYPYTAMDSSNQSVVLWEDARNGQEQMYCRRYDSSGNPLGPEFTVQDSTGTGIYGSVAMNRSGRFVAVWMNYRDTLTDWDAYCQAYRADGSAIGRNIRLNTDDGQAYQGYPACAVDEQGRFVVAWEDTRNDVYDVYLQRFDSSGTRIGSNERVNDNSVPSDAYSPSCAFAPDGRLAVEFNDERDFPGDPQIYCQRFDSDGARISFNKMVNGPNLFPNNSHWTVGQSIAASADVLAFAWTDNRRHQGFDIYAKLTDWNLVGVAEKTGDRGRGTEFAGRPSIVGRHGRLQFVEPAREGTVALYDASGRQVRHSATTESGGFDLRGISPGTYFLVTRQGTAAECRKVVVE